MWHYPVYSEGSYTSGSVGTAGAEENFQNIGMASSTEL